ncbi:Dihydrodipicolinate synthase [Coemansia sp. RSA 989]|nr:Dihydrodipicolinate synthase [Coemansia sp. RSA 1086]KAJ1748028.1 Dihydrodipicolinate synthase [Coemansia sp. RSA 1821]KAJ1864596.1 Dihydrodipicolinate synthase [Coemansia sp. RSA 989]KAJ1872048.1 Dihydrodipicolinate synthase [Coemansia sp. RSA 990]KAJ2670941.1 Dihydrodipicolinate synthase [Coemansia sp. RSA 1085]
MAQQLIRETIVSLRSAGQAALERLHASPLCAHLKGLEPYVAPSLQSKTQLALLGIAGFFVLRIVLASFWGAKNEQFSMGKVRRRAIATKRKFTPRELAEFDGKDASTPLYMGVQGIVYDVSESRHFYGPEGPYCNFAGRDATRGLAMSTFDSSILSDLDAPVDRLDDLNGTERATLEEWVEFFAGKYTPVGTLVDPPAAPKKDQ